MVGETVGSYVIERRLGEGGMGTVFEARHQGFGRRAAVKILKPEHCEKPDIVQRFVNEARAAAAIEHPGIIDVLDVGTTAAGHAYLVMELLDGEPLSARIKRGALGVDAATRIARQVADALAAAHARGIVHRDLKPDNVFLVRDPEVSSGERAKLLDFGIAKLRGELVGDGPGTFTGAIIGTPVYMSPEQCRGAQEIDARADLYALGCVLHEMLSGRPPFMARGLGDLLSKHMFEAPPPLDGRVPAELAALVMQLLAKDPRERPASAREVVAALGGATPPTPPRASDDARPDASLDTMAPALAETAASSPGHTVTGAAGQSDPIVKPRRKLAPWLIGGAIVVAAGVAIAATQLGDRGSTTAAVTTVPTPDARALVAPELGPGFVAALVDAHGSALAPYDTASAWRSAAHDFEVAAAQAGAPATWQAGALGARGWAETLEGDDEAAAADLTTAAADDPGAAWIDVGLASSRSRLGDQPGAISAAEEAQRLAPHWWQAFAAEARIYRDSGQLDRAIEIYRRALTTAPDEPALLGELALVYHAAGLDDEAGELATKALAGDPDLGSAHLVLAERALEAKDGKTALDHADRVVAIDSRSASGQAARGDALVLLGRTDDAKQAFELALAIEKNSDQRSLSPERIARIQQALASGLKKPPGFGHKDRSHKKNVHLENLRADCLNNPFGCD